MLPLAEIVKALCERFLGGNKEVRRANTYVPVNLQHIMQRYQGTGYAHQFSGRTCLGYAIVDADNRIAQIVNRLG